MKKCMVQNKNILGVCLLVSVTMLTGVFLSSERIGATSASTTAAVTVAEACTMTATVDTPHTATISPNTYQENIGITTINVVCNDPNGYALYAVGYTGNEIGGTNSTKLVGTQNNTSTISTGTATSGTTSNWAMKLATSGSSYVATLDNSFGSYHNVPSEYTKVAHLDSATDAGTNATGSTLITTYAAYINGSQGADTYTGKVKYVMVHPQNESVPHEVACTAGYICYNANTNIVEGQMGQQSASNDANIILYAPNFKKDGYGFAGWSDKYDYETNPDASFYGPNQTITTPSDTSTNGLSLYAVWIKSEGSLQGWNSCSSLTQAPTDGTADLSSVTALTDERDNDTYAVARLADGKCWMIENLRLADKDANGNDVNLSSTNTHNPSLPLTNIYDSSTTSNHLSPTSSVAYDAINAPEGWCDTDSSACIDQSRLRTDNTVLFTNNTSSSYSASGNVYSYGNYYNWYSATAGHGKYGSSYGGSYNAPGDICPAGWHLLSESADYSSLDVAMGGTGGYQNGDEGTVQSAKWRSYPNNIIFSGGFSELSFNNRNTYGHYALIGSHDERSTVNLCFGRGYVYTGVFYKHSGDTVRCISGT